MAKFLVIVESPTKAKTISRFLGGDFHILSSYGHVRDLPKSTMGVDVEHNFTPEYVISADSKGHVASLKKAAKARGLEAIYFATDEDREGEAISWHLLELLKPDASLVKRIAFHEITKEAIQHALDNPRAIDMNLVNAQQARRILDRLVGYELSPLIWKKIAYGLSAGRVQSVAVRLIVEREVERMNFRSASYWDLLAKLAKGGSGFEAKLTSVDGKRVATGKDFDEHTGELHATKDVVVLKQHDAEKLKKGLTDAAWTVASVEEKPVTVRPSAPFITSSLQQEGNRKLGLSSRNTMRIAQSLYEQGFITYMRTDSPALSNEGIGGARADVERLYGKDYLSPQPRQFASKAKSAQEAHEAIRPAGAPFQHPKDTGLAGKDLALYELIWKRTLASQMADARKMTMTVQLEAANALFTATGSRILFPGFLRVYVEGSDDPDAALEDKDVVLPKLAKGDGVDLTELLSLEHTTKPPARYTDASLVKVLEQNGVGRPSTYASIIGTIIDRGYVVRAGNALVPTFQGFAVTHLLEKHFAKLVDTRFTSRMEDELDEIAEGKRAWEPYLKEFYFGQEGLHGQVREQEEKIDPKDARSIKLPNLDGVEIRVGKFGPYVVENGNGNGDEATHASIPQDVAPADLTKDKIDELIHLQKNGPTSIGTDPATELPVYVLTGRFGPYVQLGETPPKAEKPVRKKRGKAATAEQDSTTPAAPKPRRASLPRGKNPREVTLEEALKYLSLPRTLGQHPETGKDVNANVGRFGPYVVHDGNFRSIPKDEDVYTITHDRALKLLAQEKKGRNGQKFVKDLGKHPTDDQPVAIYDGKYGMYVKHKRTNATLPKDADPEKFTLEEAVRLLEERKGNKKSRKSTE